MSISYAALFGDVGAVIHSVNEIRGQAVGSPTNAAKAITGITAANPAVVTATSHGLRTGDRVYISGVSGMVEVNDIEFLVNKVNANTFQLYDATLRTAINSSGYTAYSSGGVVFRGRCKPYLNQLSTDVKEVFSGNNTENVLSGVPELFLQFQSQVVGWVGSLGEVVTRRLTDRTTVIEQLSGLGGSTDVVAVLRELFRDMTANSESIQRSTVTLGSVTADSGNHGSGVVLLDKVLDAVTPPHSGYPVVPQYRDLDSELSVSSETMSLTCVGDEDSDGLVAGEELFVWRGLTSPNGAFDYNTEGSNTNRTISVLNAETIIANKDFEAWSSNVPESWDLDNGTAGTHVIQEGTGANVFRGSYGMKITGDGSQATIGISQTLPLGILVPGKRYLLSVRVKGQASTLAGTLTIEFESPSSGYTAGSSEKITMDATALSAATSWTHQYFYITAPTTIPDDLELVIKVTGTLTSAKSVWVDSLAFGAVQYANGINVAVIAGATQFTRNDRFTFPITNDDLGIIQTFLRKQYRMQLPSASSPTRKDLLAG